MGTRTARGGKSSPATDIVLALIVLLLVSIVGGLLVLNDWGWLADAPAPAARSIAPLPPATISPPTLTAAPPTETPLPTPTPLAAPSIEAIPTITPDAWTSGVAAPLRPFEGGVINVLLIGSDRRSAREVGRSDVLIVASVDPGVPSLTMLSIPRDLWVTIPNWGQERINVADVYGARNGFPGGGPALLKQTIQYNLGIPIDYYARVDFTGFRQLIDAVGGIDVIADCALYDEFPDVPDDQTDLLNGFDLQTVPVGVIDIPAPGVYHLDGKHALWYARSRSNSNDFARSRRQQRVLRGLWTAIQQRGLVRELPVVWDSLARTVDTDLSLNDALYLANVGAQIDPAHIRSRFLDGSVLYEFTSPTGAFVLGYEAGRMQAFLDEVFAPLPANVTAQAGAWVDVRNGTPNKDWDLVAVDRLSWAGYNVSAWGAADALYPRTVIVDHSVTPKGSRLDDLAQLFFVSPENVLSQPDPNSAVAYQVIVGSDFNPCRRR
jgi:LCP family protein required for cell wall assembly